MLKVQITFQREKLYHERPLLCTQSMKVKPTKKQIKYRSITIQIFVSKLFDSGSSQKRQN